MFRRTDTEGGRARRVVESSLPIADAKPALKGGFRSAQALRFRLERNRLARPLAGSGVVLERHSRSAHSRRAIVAWAPGLTRHFEISGDFEGHAILDVPTQKLRYELQWLGVPGDEIIDLKLHKVEKYGAGPVIALLGKDRRGEIAVRNEDLDSLLAGKIYFALYPRQKPLGAARAWIR
jgi:hypothetical protein